MADDRALFAGAASWYARYRIPYPDALIANIVSHFGLDGTGRLLDLGCGPGTLTFPLAPYFEHVIAADPDAGMIAEAKRIAEERGVYNIAFEVRRAEDLTPDMRPFRLVTCGSSFHWMDRDVVLSRARHLLEPGGGIALSAGNRPWWDGPEDWHQAITTVVKRYLGDQRRAGVTVFNATGELFEQTLPRNGWRVELVRDYPMEHTWDLEGVIGHLWSTSFAARPLFGDRVDAFEREVREALMAARPDGRFPDSGTFGLVCGRPSG